MKIERNGFIYELTPEELRHAYWEQENNYDIEDVKGELNVRYESMEDDDLSDFDEEKLFEFRAIKEILADKALLSGCAYEKRRNMEKYGCSWEVAVEEAVSDTIARLVNGYRKEMPCEK